MAEPRPPATARDVPTEVRPERPGRAAARFAITVAIGAEPGQSLVVEATRPARAFVGQSELCDLRLVDRQVSRRHLALECAGGQLRVTDLGSTNGTVVNGVRVVEALLDGGERLRIGDTTLDVARLEDAPPAPVVTARSFGRVQGASAEMRRLYPVFERLAASEITLLIEGETGTGKELLAESIHELGPRSAGPFVVFDCAAVSASQAPSRLFGDASTGALGVFEQAHGGTLFLDEIGELDPSIQPQLLRAIERGEVPRIGDDRVLEVDARIVAATRHDLEHATQEKRFRDDLYFRLALARVELPPLRRRRGDVGHLARHFWQTLGGDAAAMPYAAFERMEDALWPGNVRELQGAVLRHIELGELVDASGPRSGLEPSIGLGPLIDPALPYAKVRERVIRELERQYVEASVSYHSGHVQRAAAASGLALRYFQVLRARHRAEPGDR